MATIQTPAGTFIVPDSVTSDYDASVVQAPEDEPSEEWTVAQLRDRAREQGVPYKGLRKDELLEALE